MKTWFEKELEKLRTDPEYQALEILMDLTEKICELHGQPKGYRAVLFWLLEWSAEKLIYYKPDQKEAKKCLKI